MKKILIVTAVQAEKEAVQKGIGDDPRFVVHDAGVGTSLAAAFTAKTLALEHFQLVISTGIAGGFTDKVEVCSTVLGTEIIAADLGVETQNGFQSIDTLGFGTNRLVAELPMVQRMYEALQKNQLPVYSGPILTVSTITGTADSANSLSLRYPEAVAEAMEGFGVATAATLFEIPVLELRTISNAIGPRDRENWKIRDALEALTSTFKVIKEVF